MTTDTSINAMWMDYRANMIGADFDRDQPLVQAAELGFWAGALAMLNRYHQMLMAFHHGQIGVGEVMLRYTEWLDEFEAPSRFGHSNAREGGVDAKPEVVEPVFPVAKTERGPLSVPDRPPTPPSEEPTPRFAGNGLQMVARQAAATAQVLQGEGGAMSKSGEWSNFVPPQPKEHTDEEISQFLQDLMVKTIDPAVREFFGVPIYLALIAFPIQAHELAMWAANAEPTERHKLALAMVELLVRWGYPVSEETRRSIEEH